MAPAGKALGEAAFADQIKQSIPETTGETIHIAMDNYATHKTPRVQRWLTSRPMVLTLEFPFRNSLFGTTLAPASMISL